MKNAKFRLCKSKPSRSLFTALGATLLPSACLAANGIPLLELPAVNVESVYLIAAAMLAFGALITLIILARKFHLANNGIKDLTAELGHTRDRLAETVNQVDATQQLLNKTKIRNEETYLEAHVGLFQMDTKGTCTYINTALQEMSGLYPKKAKKEGLESAIHDDDRQAFKEAWDRFTGQNEPFNMRFRFKRPKGKHVYVQCRANRILNEKKDADFYMGWVTDVTRFHEEEVRIKTETKRYEYFVEESHEGYFQLTPEKPIPLSAPANKMAESILSSMKLSGCNETFSAMYGASPAELINKTVNELQDGCGPLRNSQAIHDFIQAELKSINLETIRHDPNGNRLNLLSNVVGLIENDHLVGIWGSQRNISQQKREKLELANQAQFLKRILGSLPADVYVKDTRCRYLYASSKLAEQTGIPQEEWIGKTTSEVLPGTPRDHDKASIEVMKSGKMSRRERPFEARGRTGWMETLQIPLVSNEGLVEGIIGLSIDTTERRKKEEIVQKQNQQLDQQLAERTASLQESRHEHSTTADALTESIHKLHIAEAEHMRMEKELTEKLTDRKCIEEALRSNESHLLTRQRELEKQLNKHLTELNEQSQKVKTWEELLAIKEDALQKIEAHEAELQQQFATECDLRRKVEAKLKSSRAAESAARYELDTLTTSVERERSELLSRHKNEVAQLESRREQDLGAQKTEHESAFRSEHEQRKGAERKLNKTKTLLQQTQEQLKQTAEQHSKELEHEVAERKASAEKLMQSMGELQEFKQQFNRRIEAETKTIKQELAKKQIREKTMRQHEKELEARIAELENNLQRKGQEYDEQLRARKDAERQQQKTEQQLEMIKKQQEQFVASKTQKLNLNIAEIRQDEIKLRKQVGDVQQKKEQLERLLETRTAELAETAKERKDLSVSLKKTQSELKQLAAHQTQMVAEETKALQNQLLKLQQVDAGLRQQAEKQQDHIRSLEEAAEKVSEQLVAETSNRERIEQVLQTLKTQFEEDQEEAQKRGKQHGDELRVLTEQHQLVEDGLRLQAEKQQEHIRSLEEAAEKLNGQLVAETANRGRIEQVLQTVKTQFEEHQEEAHKRGKQHGDDLRVLTEQHRQVEDGLRLQAEKQQEHIRSLEEAAEKLNGQLVAETANRGRIEQALQTVQTQLEKHQEEAQKRGKQHGDDLRVLTEQHQQAETALTEELKQLQDMIAVLEEQLSETTRQHNDAVEQIKETELFIGKLKEQYQEELSGTRHKTEALIELVEGLGDVVAETLVSVVQTSESMAQNNSLSADQKLKLKKIPDDCHKVVDMMNYSGELSRLTTADPAPQDNTCKLHDLIKELEEQFCDRAELKKLFFAVSFSRHQSSNSIPELVETDTAKLRRALSILLNYAVDKTNKGRLGLHATRKSAANGIARISFDLAYTASQRNDERLIKLFGLDDQAPEAHTETKYGLSVAQRYVEMLGGTIQHRLREGGVTVLTLDFPFKEIGSGISQPSASDERAAGAA